MAKLPQLTGADNVGKPLPAYMTGDECLFCHRETGSTWSDARHQLTMRPANLDEVALAKLSELDGGNNIVADVQYLVGSQRLTRFLRRSQAYGKRA
jgi:hypothetical protein